MSNTSKTPNLFLYSLVLPVFWLGFGLIANTLIPGERLGVFGLVLVIYATLAPICWHFTKNYQRHFNTKEKVMLIVLFTFWAVACELYGLWYYVSLESNISFDSILPVIGITVLMDAVFMILAVQFAARRINNYFLEGVERKE